MEFPWATVGFASAVTSWTFPSAFIWWTTSFRQYRDKIRAARIGIRVVFQTAVGICLIFKVSGHAAGSSGTAGTLPPWVVQKISCRNIFNSVADKTVCVKVQLCCRFLSVSCLYCIPSPAQNTVLCGSRNCLPLVRVLFQSCWSRLWIFIYECLVYFSNLLCLL